MKKLVLLFIVIVMSIVKMAAQEEILKATGLHFRQPVKDRQWTNHHTDTYSDATYKEFTGQVYFTLTPVKAANISLAYDIVVKEGKLEMEVTDTDGNTLLEHTFNENKKDTEIITLAAGKEYKIKFTGKQTSGSYKCKWGLSK